MAYKERDSLHPAEDWLWLIVKEIEAISPKLRAGVYGNAMSLLRCIECGNPVIYPETRVTVDGCLRIEWRNIQGHTLNISVFGPRNFRWRRIDTKDSGIQTERKNHREMIRRLVSEFLNVNRSDVPRMYADLNTGRLP